MAPFELPVQDWPTTIVGPRPGEVEQRRVGPEECRVVADRLVHNAHGVPYRQVTLGISGSLQMADAAFGFELPVLLSGYPGHVPVHLFPALPTSMSVEIPFTGFADTAAHGVTFAAGRALAGTKPGNGLSFESGGTS